MAPQETEPKPASVGGPPVEEWVGRGSPQGWGHWKVPLGVNPLGGHRASKPHGWVAPGQTTNKVGPANQSKTQFSPPPVPPIGMLTNAS